MSEEKETGGRTTGETGLRRMEAVCGDAVHVQERFLTELLKRNSGTEYGRKWGFSNLHTVEDYQRQVPLSRYDDYESLIERQIGGEKGLLTADEPVFYCISAGSTSQPKYVPITRRDVTIHRIYQLDVVQDVIRKELADVPDEKLFGKIFETGEFFRTAMPDGTMNGVRSGVLMRWMESGDELDFSQYTSPREVMFPEKMENMSYIKLRFALACRDVTAIHGVFVHGMVQIFRYLLEHWDAFVKDVGSGEVSGCFGVSDSWKNYIKERLAPDPVRAEELRAAAGSGKAGLVRRVWPKLRYIRMAGGSIFQGYMDELRLFIGDLPIHFYAFASSESTLGAVYTLREDDARYVLIPESCFFEFLPEGETGERTLTFREVEAGKSYELVVTTLSGLYRYVMGDIVEVTGFYGQAPVIRMSRRKSQVLNVADEKMDMRQLEKAMLRFECLSGYSLESYCVGTGFRGSTPFYSVYLEPKTGALPADADKLLDDCLRDSCFSYRGAREMGQIGDVQVLRLKKGAFAAYRDFLAGQGYRMEQNKPIHILQTEEQKDFFNGETER